MRYCQSDMTPLFESVESERVAYQRIEGYYASRDNCVIAANKLQQEQPALDAHLAGYPALVGHYFKSGKVRCDTITVNP